jgi:hypothetical protein
VTPDPAATGEPAGTVGSDEGGSYAVEAADLGSDGTGGSAEPETGAGPDEGVP